MSKNPATAVETAEEERMYQPAVSLDRRYVSQLERIVYVIKASLAGFGLGKYDTGSDIFLYQIYGLKPLSLAKAQGTLLIYDMINDPLSAAIIDNMRTRFGKFKPFLYLAFAPNTALGLFNCLLPYIAVAMAFSDSKRLLVYMISAWIGETIGALFGGGGYIDNVFTPNPNERTELLTISKFLGDLYAKAPELIAGIIIDLVDDGVIQGSIVNVYVVMKTTCWLIATVPGIIWTFVSKERVAQSIKPPKVTTSITSVFKNGPLLIYTLSNCLDGVDIGTSESLYFRNVLGLSSFGVLFGLPGSPISYLSYIIAPKLRARFSTKTLWFVQRGSILISELQFFLVGALGKRSKTYKKVGVMGTSFMLGNCLEMFFYALKKIIGQEINYEVQDYCEWKNGFRVEATMGLITNYIGKVEGYLLKLINAWILQVWTGFESGITAVQSEKTQYRLFLMAYGPKLVPDIISMIPMLFYNLSDEKRDQMYAELAQRRSALAEKVTSNADETKQNEIS